MSLNTLFVGRNLIKLNEVNSTNSFALEYIQSAKTIDGTVVWALAQNSGRGQRGNNWYSEPGKNLTFSLILQTSFLKVIDSFELNKFVSVSIINALRELLPNYSNDFKIKWPNDIYYKEQKIGGILIENSIKGAYFSYSVIGIGINVNQLTFDESIGSKTSSLARISSKDFGLEEVLNTLLKQLEICYLQLKNNQLKEIHLNYFNDLLGLNEERKFIYNSKEITATVVNVDAAGKLVLNKSNKDTVTCGFKEIVWISPVR